MTAAALLLGGCGGPGASSAPASTAELAKTIGCTGFAVNPDGKMFAREVGSCQLGDDDVYLAVFSDEGQRDQWLEVATTTGGGGSFVKGPSWTAQTGTIADATKIA